MNTLENSGLILTPPPLKIKINKNISKRLLAAPREFEELQNVIRDILQRRALNNGRHNNTDSFKSNNESVSANEPFEITYLDADGDKTLIEDQHDYDIALDAAKQGNLLSISADTSEKKNHKHKHKKGKEWKHLRRGERWSQPSQEHSGTHMPPSYNPMPQYYSYYAPNYGAIAGGGDPLPGARGYRERPNEFQTTLEILAGEMLENSGILTPQNSLNISGPASAQNSRPVHRTVFHVNQDTTNRAGSNQISTQPLQSDYMDDTQIDVYVDFLKQAFTPVATEPTEFPEAVPSGSSLMIDSSMNQSSMNSESSGSANQRNANDNQANSDIQNLVANMSIQDKQSN